MTGTYDYIANFSLGVGVPAESPLPEGYNIYIQEDGRRFRGFMREGYNMAAPEQNDGWKMHISIHPDDLSRAWDTVVAPILFDAKVGAAKFVMGEVAPRFADPNYYLAGKMITIQGAGKHEWSKVARDIELGLRREGIRPGPSKIPKDRMVNGSSYIGYRNDRAVGAMEPYGKRGYVDEVAIQDALRDGIFERGWEYNPSKQPDPFEKIDFTRDLEVLAAHDKRLLPSRTDAAANIVDDYLQTHCGQDGILGVARRAGGYDIYVFPDFSRGQLAKAGIADPTGLQRDTKASRFFNIITIPEECLPAPVVAQAYDAGMSSALHAAGVLSADTKISRTTTIHGAPAYAIEVPPGYDYEKLTQLGVDPKTVEDMSIDNGRSRVTFSMAAVAHLMSPPQPSVRGHAPRPKSHGEAVMEALSGNKDISR